jgi:TorA maturation chaperone TorD
MPTPSEDSRQPRSGANPVAQGNALGEADACGTDVALCRATLYAALALGFQPPTEETLTRLTHAGAAAALADAALHLTDPDGSLAAAARALARPGLQLDALAAAHRRLFGHTARGPVPPYETEYGSEALFQQPQELSDLAGFMRAFGLVVRPAAHERVDHVSCECEFVAFLACKEAYSIGCGAEAMRATTVHATMLFLRDHLGRFAPAFVRLLRRHDGGLYRALGDLLLGLVRDDCRRLGIGAGPEGLGLRPDPAVCAAPMGCAETGGDCTILQRTP